MNNRFNLILIAATFAFAWQAGAQCQQFCDSDYTAIRPWALLRSTATPPATPTQPSGIVRSWSKHHWQLQHRHRFFCALQQHTGSNNTANGVGSTL